MDQPLFYTVKRGSGDSSLDMALLDEARSLGVEVVFNSKVNSVSGAAILATGPKQADAIAVGYQFDTSMENGFWVICDNNIAPAGYAYLLVMNGIGTLKSCQFRDFGNQNIYVEKTLRRFQELLDLDIRNPVKHGGAGNFFLPQSVFSGTNPVADEQAGLQDTLWGFGIRYAVRSGVMAANSLLGKNNYSKYWQQSLMPLQRASIVNRWIYSMLGNRGYRWALKYVGRHNAQHILKNLYRHSAGSKILFPLANVWFRTQSRSYGCHHADCDCVWCKHLH